jgi:antirestriction protein ArdC
MNIYESITNRIIETLESGTIPWRKEWKVSGGSGQLPYNLASGKPYRGVNIISLLCSGYSSAGWVTYKQAQGMGYQVRKGEKSSPVVFWKFPARATVATVADDKQFPFAKFYNVFNVEQLDGVPAALPFDVQPFDAIEAAESVVTRYMDSPSHPTLGHGGSKAYFRLATDHVQMPDRESFTTPAGYYSTLFHEFTHSTGIKARLDREELKGMMNFGDSEYSKEELTAEFGAAFLCGEAGIANDQILTNSAAYIQSWIQKLKNDKTMVVQAAQRAQKAADYILQRSAVEAVSEAA